MELLFLEMKSSARGAPTILSKRATDEEPRCAPEPDLADGCTAAVVAAASQHPAEVWLTVREDGPRRARQFAKRSARVQQPVSEVSLWKPIRTVPSAANARTVILAYIRWGAFARRLCADPRGGMRYAVERCQH